MGHRNSKEPRNPRRGTKATPDGARKLDPQMGHESYHLRETPRLGHRHCLKSLTRQKRERENSAPFVRLHLPSDGARKLDPQMGHESYHLRETPHLGHRHCLESTTRQKREGEREGSLCAKPRLGHRNSNEPRNPRRGTKATPDGTRKLDPTAWNLRPH